MVVLIIANTTFAQLGPNHTYYYELVAKVTKNGTKSNASGDGHYITMNNRYLYESNAQGHTMNRGRLEYTNSNNGFPTFEGDGYLGRGLCYRFSSDYSRLNLILYDGTTLVYVRKNKANPSLMRQYEEEPPSPTIIGDPSQTSGTNRSSGERGKSNNRNNDYIEYKCVYCNGSGRELIERQKNMTTYGIASVEMVTCNECGKKYDSGRGGMIHKHQTCSHCHGKGKIRKKL